MPVKSKSNELQITRVYDAPVKVVWDAWADSAQAGQWWGPRGFTITTHSKDLKAGGHWHYTMHGPDGVDYANKTLYLEVDECKKLIYDHGGNDEQKPLFRVTVLFSEINGKTKMEMTMALPTAEEAKFVKQAGGNATWDRLAEYIEKIGSGKEKFVINRSFAVPVERLFQAWANPDEIVQWLAPVGFEMQLIRSDIRTGGNSFFCMSNASGLKMYARAQYLEVSKPSLIVYTQQFCDENEKTSRHPLAPIWPETMLVKIEFAAEGPDQSRVTVSTECHGQTKPDELATFIEGRAGMTIGWTGSFDKLESFLDKK